MDDLVRWLGKQLDEDERIAKAAGARSLQWKLATPLDDAELGDAHWLRPDELKHAERHDPARVLREVDAKRALLRRANGGVDDPHTHPGEHDADHLGRHHDDGLLRLLALPYADRPDYREEWRP